MKDNLPMITRSLKVVKQFFIENGKLIEYYVTYVEGVPIHFTNDHPLMIFWDNDYFKEHFICCTTD